MPQYTNAFAGDPWRRHQHAHMYKHTRYTMPRVQVTPRTFLTVFFFFVSAPSTSAPSSCSSDLRLP